MDGKCSFLDEWWLNEFKQCSNKSVCFYLIWILVYQPMKTDCIKILLLEMHFFNCYLTVPPPSLGHCWGDSFTHPMLITSHCVLNFRSESHREPRNKAGSLSTAERLLEFEPGTFRFLMQRLNRLGHSSQIIDNGHISSSLLTSSWWRHSPCQVRWLPIQDEFFLLLAHLFSQLWSLRWPMVDLDFRIFPYTE